MQKQRGIIDIFSLNPFKLIGGAFLIEEIRRHHLRFDFDLLSFFIKNERFINNVWRNLRYFNDKSVLGLFDEILRF
jgi:hypothetical protein